MSSRVIQIVDHNPDWASAFVSERSLLRSALGDIVVEIHHVDSTAVSGLSAKPVIDLLMEVSDLAALDKRAQALASLGYKAKGENGIAGRRYFQKGGDSRSHHLHAFCSGDENLVRHIAFRDYLRSHSLVKAEYGRLKRCLVSGDGIDPAHYQNGKADFISMHERVALQWYVTHMRS